MIRNSILEIDFKDFDVKGMAADPSLLEFGVEVKRHNGMHGAELTTLLPSEIFTPILVDGNGGSMVGFAPQTLSTGFIGVVAQVCGLRIHFANPVG